MTADVCGRTSRLANVAPPLKSTRTKFSVSDECVSARPSTSVRSSSDLPEPVAPMTSPCGPMPPCADSLMSSSTGWPLGADADRHPQPVARCARAPGDVGVDLVRVAEAQQVGQAEVGGQRVLGLGGRGRHAQRGHPPRQRLGLDRATACRRRPSVLRSSRAVRLAPHHRERAVAPLVDLEPQHAVAPVGAERAAEVEDGDARARGSSRAGPRCGTRPPSSTTTTCGPSAPLLDAEALPSGERVAEHRLDVEQVVAEQAHLADGVVARRGSSRAAAT